jgi:hypothetical protein
MGLWISTSQLLAIGRLTEVLIVTQLITKFLFCNFYFGHRYHRDRKFDCPTSLEVLTAMVMNSTISSGI